MILGPPPEEVTTELDQQLRERRDLLDRKRDVLADFYYADDLARGRVPDRRHQPRPQPHR